MATIETNPQLGAQVKADAKEFVLHSWSVQSAIDPIPVAGAEGRYFWDYEGKRYLDFASQLVNVSIGYGHPKVIAAIKDQAERLCTIGPPMATEPRSTHPCAFSKHYLREFCARSPLSCAPDVGEDVVPAARVTDLVHFVHKKLCVSIH